MGKSEQLHYVLPAYTQLYSRQLLPNSAPALQSKPVFMRSGAGYDNHFNPIQLHYVLPADGNAADHHDDFAADRRQSRHIIQRNNNSDGKPAVSEFIFRKRTAGINIYARDKHRNNIRHADNSGYIQFYGSGVK